MERQERLYTLDGLRGIAAILVLLSHMDSVIDVARSGYLAVDFFFALSGLVIAKTYTARLQKELGLWQFFQIRIIRFYPLFVIGLVIGLGRAVAQNFLNQPTALTWPEIASALILGMLMLPSNSSLTPIYPINGPAWTLLFELIVNIAFALWLVKIRPKYLMILCAVFAVGLWIWADGTHGLGRGGGWGESHIGFCRVFFSFTLGALLYNVWLKQQTPTHSALCLLPIAIAVALMIYAPDPRFRPIYDFFCIVVVFPIVLVLGAKWNPPTFFQGFAATLGDLSYPLYVTHYSLIFVGTFAAREFGWPVIVWVPIFVFTLLTFSYWLAHYVDAPARRWLTKLAMSRLKTARSA